MLLQETVAATFLTPYRKAQYERMLKLWGISKYTKGVDWKFIAQRYDVRARDGQRTALEIQGKRISERKVKKEIARQGYMNTIERFNYQARSQTPPDIRFFTPSSSPPMLYNDIEESPQAFQILPRPIPNWTDENFLILAQTTPWNLFIDSIRPLNTGTGDLLVIPSRHTGDRSTISFPDVDEALEIIKTAESSSINAWIERIVFELCTMNLIDDTIHPACIAPRAYLPALDEAYDINITAVIDMSTRSTQLEFLKHAVHLMSNNFDIEHIGPVVVDLLRDKRNRTLLETLIDQNLIATSAFLEKLMIFTIKASNIELLRIMCRNGVDLQREYGLQGAFTVILKTPLRIALEYGNLDVLRFLLEQGANNSEGPVQHNSKLANRSFCEHERLLEIASFLGDFQSMRELLIPRPHTTYVNPRISLDVLRWAILHSSLDSYNFLLSQAPELLDQARIEPWIILEAAAIQKDRDLFDVILNSGLDISESDSNGRGSVLAAAYQSQDLERVKLLHSLGANLSSIAVGYKNPLDSQRKIFFDNCYPLGGSRYNIDAALLRIEGFSILHLAVADGNEETVIFLIDIGADVNQCCNSVVPLQIALCRSNELIVETLLKAGADVNFPSGSRNDNVSCRRSLISVVGQPAMKLALESGSLSIVDMIVRNDTNSIPYNMRFSSRELIRWSIKGENKKLVQRVMNEFISAVDITSEILGMLVKKYGCSFSFDVCSRKIDLDPAIIYSAEVIKGAVFHHDAESFQVFLDGAIETPDVLHRGSLVAGMALACLFQKPDMIQVFINAGIKSYELPDDTRDFYPDDLNACFSPLEEIFYHENFPSTAILDMLLTAADRPEGDSDLEALWRKALYESCLEATRGENFNLNVMKKFISTQMEINWTPPRRRSILQQCIKVEEMVTAKYLIGMNAHVNAPGTMRGGTALQCAASSSDHELFEMLLKRGASPFAKPYPRYGATATQYAAMSGNFAYLHSLLKLGVSINEPPGEHEGRTAIEGAAEHGRLNIVSFLLQAGADVKGKTNINYRRTVYRALLNGHQTIVDMIQNWKSQMYSADDCDDVSNIVETMSRNELDFENESARIGCIMWDEPDSLGNSADWEDLQKRRVKVFEREKERLLLARNSRGSTI